MSLDFDGELIGRGATADVRLGRLDGRPVAVKLLRPEFRDDANALEELRREAEVLSEVEHPSIVRLLVDGTTHANSSPPSFPSLRSFPSPPSWPGLARPSTTSSLLSEGVVDGRAKPGHDGGDGNDRRDEADAPFLMLEHLGGGSLQREKPLPPSNAAQLLAGIADALAVLHRRGIVHGDIKPAHLLRDDAGRVKLIDFGAARRIGEPPRPVRLATAAYAPPEAMLGLPPDPRDDVFSLAVVFYQLLTGRHPFAGDPVLAMTVPARPPGLDDDAWTWLRAALSPARAERPNDAPLLTELAVACPA